jgi:hypothetical protein
LKTVVKVALGLVLGMVVLIGGCVALIGAGVDDADDEQRKKGITLREFRSVSMGSSRADVRAELGKPEDAQEFESAGIEGLDNTASRGSCIYYPEKGKGLFEGRSFQLCFTDGRLDSKNVY